MCSWRAGWSAPSPLTRHGGPSSSMTAPEAGPVYRERCPATAERDVPREDTREYPGQTRAVRLGLDAGEAAEVEPVEEVDEGRRPLVQAVGEEQEAEPHQEHARDEVDGAGVALDPTEDGREPAEGDARHD